MSHLWNAMEIDNEVSICANSLPITVLLVWAVKVINISNNFNQIFDRLQELPTDDQAI